ncbi:ribonuclease Z [Kurthia senegalensis]|uniref:ribonuclease Z n=1 Tax=Kurthia senegalensis TaxID=1033740 RepID=UPI000288390F|nr:ribonuclease Z [Kurthia senegalensis]
MQIQFLGTGAGMPSKLRKTSSLALKLLEERGAVWLFDCGEACQHQILETSIRPRKIEKIFITHLHGDHIFGLPGFLGSRSFLGGDTPLTIYGPTGIKEWVEMTNRLTGTHLTYPIHFVEVTDGVVFEDEQFCVTAKLLEHVIPCYGYRVEQKPLSGALDLEKAISLGVPKGPLLGQLKAGEAVRLEDGRTVYSEDVTGAPVQGFTVTILGDTRFCESAAELAQNATILIHEATFDASTANLASQYGHSTNVDAATIAEQANVDTLLLNHISARFLKHDIERMEAETKKIHAKSYIVHDFTEFQWMHRQIVKVRRTEEI